MGDAEGPLAEALRDDPGVASVVDDPTYVRTMTGDLSALGERFADQSAESWGLAHLEGHHVVGLLDNETLAEVVGPEQPGVDPAEVLQQTVAELREVGRGERPVADLSDGAARAYAELAMRESGDERFEARARLAAHPDPSIAAGAFADIVASGDTDALQDLTRWAEENGVSDVLTITTEVVAGSTDLRALGRALDGHDGRGA